MLAAVTAAAAVVANCRHFADLLSSDTVAIESLGVCGFTGESTSVCQE